MQHHLLGSLGVYASESLSVVSLESLFPTFQKMSQTGSFFAVNNQEDLDNALHADILCTVVAAQEPTALIPLLKRPEHLPGKLVFALAAESRFLHRSSVANDISLKLYSNGLLSGDMRQPLRLVLQEALLNAIEHGNLGLSSVRDKGFDTQKWYDVYYERVASILENTAEGQKPVAIFITEENNTLYVAVQDVGAGFDHQKIYAEMDVESPYGKGLSLAAALSETVQHDDGGRLFTFRMNGIRSAIGHKTPDRTIAKEQGRILVVDDQQVNRDLCLHFFRSAGFRFLETAENGKEAIKKAKAFKPDLILMDIMMPEMDGFEACKILKSAEETRHIPVLFLSGLTDVSSRTKGYQLGAVDYVNKPINREEMVARAEVHILNGMMYRYMKEYSSRIMEDLDNARQFQVQLLPTQRDVYAVERQYDLMLESDYRPTDELAGDYWGVFQLDEDRVALTMVDFSGHGVLAALNTIRLHAYFKELEPLMEDPGLMAAALNQRLYNMLPVDAFATLFFGVLSPKTGELEYISCGAPPAVVIPNQQEERVLLLEASGFPVGVVKDEEFAVKTHKVKLNPRSTLFLYSDALVETRHKDGKMWEEDGLLKAIEGCRRSMTGESLMQEILRKFYRTAHKPLRDDLTLLSVKLQKRPKFIKLVKDDLFDGVQAGVF